VKRNIFDVERWHIYLHRRAAGLPLVDSSDSREKRLADEIFGRLYAGDLDEVPEAQRDPKDADWSKGCHEEIQRTLGDAGLQKLAGECRGDPKKSAYAAKTLMDALPQTQQAAQAPSGTAKDAAQGLNQVDMAGAGWGGKWQGEKVDDARARKLADRLRSDERLKKIALLAGKFKRVVISKQKTRVKRGADEITDVVQGDDLARLLPTEMAKIASSRYRLAAIRDLMERKLLEYEMTSVEVLGRGPLILCLDKSPSMEGDPDIWASAVALALLDMVHRQHRTFILLGFCDEVFYRKVVKPGRPLPEDALFVPLRGGTNISKVLDLALNACETRTVMKRADIVIVTDGGSDTSTAGWIRERAKAKDVSILGVGIGTAAETLAPWCGEVLAITDLNGIDDEDATKLFGMSS
jgi:uncharacterized protein with von Willebrand factor type A (vWA) domain